jgi:hypothetical protein
MRRRATLVVSTGFAASRFASARTRAISLALRSGAARAGPSNGTMPTTSRHASSS